MLHVKYGSYRRLEKFLLADVGKRKATNPASPLLFLSPSKRYLDYLMALFAKEGMALLDVHFQSFSSLVQALLAEGPPLSKAVLSDPVFYTTLLRGLLKDERSFDPIEDLVMPDGYPFAVRSTLRDLGDAGLPPDVGAKIREAEQGGLFESALDIGGLMDICRLYDTYKKKLEALPFHSPGDLTALAAQRATHSSFLKRFDQIYFTGFYDLTGVQTDLFETIAKEFPSTLAFPFESDVPSYSFSGRFRDTVVKRVAHQEQTLKPAKRKEPAIAIYSVSGYRDEAMACASQLIELHAKKGIAFTDMAVVVRSEERLKAARAIFDEWDIPFADVRRSTLRGRPQVTVALRSLKHLPELEKMGPAKDGYTAWAKRVDDYLAALSTVDEESAAVSKTMRASLSTFEAYDVAFPRVSWAAFLESLEELWMGLPDPWAGSRSAGVHFLHAEAARGLRFRVVAILGMEDRVFPRIVREDPFLRDDARRALDLVLGYKITQKMAALEEERLIFQLLMEAADSHLLLYFQRSNDEGRAVGMSTFLREMLHARGEKPGFELASQGENKRRHSGEGRNPVLNTTLAEGSHLDPGFSHAGMTNQSTDKSPSITVIAVPRPMSEKLAIMPLASLSAPRLFMKWLSEGHAADVLKFMEDLGGSSDWLKNAIPMATAFRSFEPAGIFEGRLPPAFSANFMATVQLSPTAFEDYAKCPFRGFVRIFLGLKRDADEKSMEVWDVRERGTAIHEFFEQLLKEATGSSASSRTEAALDLLFDRHFDGSFPVEGGETPFLFPVLWDIERDRMREILKRFFLDQMHTFNESGRPPTRFEATLEAPLPPPLGVVKWRGFADRVDEGPVDAMVVDYKTGRRLKNSLVKDIVSGAKAQAALYSFLLEAEDARNGRPPRPVHFAYLYPFEPVSASPFTAEDLEKNRAAILKSYGDKLAGLLQGDFVMVPGSYCDTCDAEALCHKNDALGVFRARRYAREVRGSDLEEGGADDVLG